MGALMRSEELFDRAKACIPGGVNSPVRAFGSVGMTPRFISRGAGCRIWDEDGREYIDYIGSWGPMILGHAHPAVLESVSGAAAEGLSFGAATRREVEMAELICSMVPSIEMVRMVNSGTEAVMSAVRAARGFTGRDKIIKFEGCYHGHSDALLVKAGSGLMTQGIPGSAGVPQGCTQDTLTARYNDPDHVRQLFAANPDQIAAVIVEPVGANMGVVLPDEGFLQALRDICDESGALLIFDEVITGFRMGFAGASAYYGIEPDLVTYGKILGGGMPVGAYGGKKEVMECVSPVGPVYQAGTLSGNPVAMAAGLATLKKLLAHPEIYDRIEAHAKTLAENLREITEYTVNQIGSLLCVYHTSQPVSDYAGACTSDLEAFTATFRALLSKGIYTAPSQFEAMFLSAAFTDEDIEHVTETWKSCV